MMVILGAKNGGGLKKTDVEVDHWKKSFLLNCQPIDNLRFRPVHLMQTNKKHEQSDCDTNKAHEKIRFRVSRILSSVAFNFEFQEFSWTDDNMHPAS